MVLLDTKIPTKLDPLQPAPSTSALNTRNIIT
jgi:hypothetical protein